MRPFGVAFFVLRLFRFLAAESKHAWVGWIKGFCQNRHRGVVMFLLFFVAGPPKQNAEITPETKSLLAIGGWTSLGKPRSALLILYRGLVVVLLCWFPFFNPSQERLDFLAWF